MMFRQSFLLEIFLMVASVLTATIMRSVQVSAQTNSDNNAMLLANSGVGGSQTPPVYSCVMGSPYNCHFTDSGTRAETVIITSFFHMYTTQNNTSLSILWNGQDTTSELARIF